MPTTPEQVDLWRATPKETQRLEFKEAKNQYDTQKLCAYCVAIANEGGGQLVLGIADQLPRQVVGTSAFPDSNDIAEKLFVWLGFRVDVDAVAHPDGRVVVFHIPSRPRGTAYHHNGKYLMRSGEETVPMSEDQLRKIFAEGQPDWLEEPSKGDLTAQEVIQLLDTQTYFELRKLPYPTDREGVLDRLRQDRLIEKSSDGSFVIRRIGALLLAKKLEDYPDVLRKAPRVVVYHGGSKMETKLDQIGGKGYAVGFQGLVQYVMAQLPQNEVIEDAIRREHKLVPEIVIRELVANALIHQDFSMTGTSVMIEIYESRVEISNPGAPIVPVERFIDGYQSRNERLADLMRRMGICEEKSSGIDKVVTTIEMYQLPAPAFNWLVQARRSAAAEGLSVVFEEGDAEALPYGSGTFDAVASLIGAMFAPHPERVAAELIRVCRPGGIIAMANWTGSGFVGQMFRTIAKHIAPSGMPSPVLWGDEPTVRERLGSGVAILECSIHLYEFSYPFSPADVVEFFRANYGPMTRAFASIGEEAQRQLRDELTGLWSRHNRATDGTTRVDAEYLQVVGVRGNQAVN